jgi:hypothetical protein
MPRRWFRMILRTRVKPHSGAQIADIFDLIHYRCPLSPLEAQVLVHRYILCKTERQLAKELGTTARVVNRAAWRMKAKIRAHLPDIRKLYPDRRL